MEGQLFIKYDEETGLETWQDLETGETYEASFSTSISAN